jgi:hypothetical protein
MTRKRLEEWKNTDDMIALYDQITYAEHSVKDSIKKDGILKELQEEYFPTYVYLLERHSLQCRARLAQKAVPEPDAEILLENGNIERLQILNIGEGYQRALTREMLARDGEVSSSSTKERIKGEVVERTSTRLQTVNVEGDAGGWVDAINRKTAMIYINTDTLIVNIRVEAYGFLDEYEECLREYGKRITYLNSIKSVHLVEGKRIWLSFNKIE